MAYADRYISDQLIDIERGVQTQERPVSGAPGVSLIHGLLTRDECAQLISEFEERGFKPKKSKRPGPPIRTNTRLLYEPHPTLNEAIEARLRPHLLSVDTSAVGEAWRLIERGALSEVWRVNRYCGDEQFFPHFDSGFSLDEGGGRDSEYERRTLLSVIIYLNECDEGETVFFPQGQRRAGMPEQLKDAEEVRVSPRAGSALIFSHYGPLSPRHAGLPAKTPKYIIRSDLFFERPRLSIRETLLHTPARPLVLLMGPAGAGKTTQAHALASALKFKALCFGDLIREARSEEGPLGEMIREDARRRDEATGRLEGGPRVPGGFLTDAVTEKLLRRALKRVPEGRGVVLEGFPRSRSQSVMLEVDALHTLGVISLEASPEVLATRLDARGRAGDERASRPARDLDWERVTAPLLDHFKKRGVLMRINAEGDPHEVTRRALSALDLRINTMMMSALPLHFKERLHADAEPDHRCYQRRVGTRVFRLGDAFVKCSVEPLASAELLGRAALHFAPLESPGYIAGVEYRGVHLLATSAVKGRDAKRWAQGCHTDRAREDLCREVASALRALHDTPLNHHEDMPTMHPYEEALKRLRDDQVPLANFSLKYGVNDPPQDISELSARFDALGRPPASPLVRVHGDPCLPNWIIREGRVIGVVDVARCGLGPRGLDIALAAWSVGYNLGAAWRERFLDLYGRDACHDVDYYVELSRFLS